MGVKLRVALPLAGCLWALLLGGCDGNRHLASTIEIATVFATAGDPPTNLDLSSEVPAGSRFISVNPEISAHLSGSQLSLNNDDPGHWGIQVKAIVPEGQTQTLLVWHTVQPAAAPAWPLQISDNGRYLVDDRGRPVAWTGATPWGLVTVPDKEDIALYLTDRARKRVNALLVRLIDHEFTDNQPAWLNVNGHPPFERTFWWGPLDFTRPVEEYWKHVDWVVREAYSHGMAVLGTPAYVGYGLGSQGWADQMLHNGPEAMRHYGQWIARRYSNYPNVVWVMGGDWTTKTKNKDVTDEVNALADGIKSIDTKHLMTAHSHRERSARDDYDQPWLDINSSYGSSPTIHVRVRLDYQREPPMPTFLIEGYYGNEYEMTERKVRTQMYQALLGGGFGQFYGNAPQWYFSAAVARRFADIKGLDWRNHLDGFAAPALKVLGGLTGAYPIHDLVPDHEHRFVTAGYGPEDSDYAPSRYSSELAVIYFPEQRPLTLDASIFSSPPEAQWINASDGTAIPAGTIPDQVDRVISPPEAGDWLLIIDAR